MPDSQFKTRQVLDKPGHVGHLAPKAGSGEKTLGGGKILSSSAVSGPGLQLYSCA